MGRIVIDSLFPTLGVAQHSVVSTHHATPAHGLVSLLHNSVFDVIHYGMILRGSEVILAHSDAFPLVNIQNGCIRAHEVGERGSRRKEDNN